MRINLEPKIWGPYAWFFLESCIIGYPDKPSEYEKDKFKQLFYLLKDIIPCSKCRINYNNHIIKYTLTDKILSNKDNLLRWLINIHNITSYKQYNLEQTLKYYNNIYSKKNNNNIICLFCIILVLIILLYYNKYYK